MKQREYSAIGGSVAENLFIDIFSEAFGAEKAGYLYSQYPFMDIYQNSRFADFVFENGSKKIAIEIDDEASHNKQLVASGKFYDDLLKQNSMTHRGWAIYRWAVRQLQNQPDLVKDELRLFLGSNPNFKELQDYLPCQRAKAIDGGGLELKVHQIQALKSLSDMRQSKQTIALLHHATGTGKTVTAVIDATTVGKRTLFVAHRQELVLQAKETFKSLWPEKSVGLYLDNLKESGEYIVCGSIQSVALNLDKFKEDDFDYIIIDEAHHAASDSYQKVLSFFRPKFTLGLTATPERNDDLDILDTFQQVAHKLDIKTAVEIGELVKVRCIRIHTNIDLSKVRFNSIQYNSRDLESKIFVPERNRLIVDTYCDMANGKKTVVFCASVKHAEDISKLFADCGIASKAVSGNIKTSERLEALEQFENGKIKVLCACDLLNEGWDCPSIEVLFMARPTMSKILYTQQLGRGMRTAEGKDCLMVFDFVDNASSFNTPYSMHRLFQLKDYRTGKLVLASEQDRTVDEDLYTRGEKPEAIIDYPVNIRDYEAVDLFNWQEEAKGMISQIEFIRRVDVQSETIEQYIRDGRLIPDMAVPMSEHRAFKYFTESNLIESAAKYGWKLISDDNRKQLFIDMITKMDMSYSYKPVLILAILKYANNKGLVKISDIVDYFRKFYDDRRQKGEIIEKTNSIFTKSDYTDKEAERNILLNPFKRFEDMDILKHTKTLGIVQIDSKIWSSLTKQELAWTEEQCCYYLQDYFTKLEKKSEGRDI